MGESNSSTLPNMRSAIHNDLPIFAALTRLWPIYPVTVLTFASYESSEAV
ncbi:MAG: hypothetical protein ACI8TQ_001100 [Planctomycetota bacterium]|jgi:hypothetical protein